MTAAASATLRQTLRRPAGRPMIRPRATAWPPSQREPSQREPSRRPPQPPPSPPASAPGARRSDHSCHKEGPGAPAPPAGDGRAPRRGRRRHLEAAALHAGDGAPGPRSGPPPRRGRPLRHSVPAVSEFAFGDVAPPEVDRDLVSPDEVFPPGPDPTLIDESNAPDASEAQLRALLSGLGGLVSFSMGNREIPNHWRFTPEELDDLTPPITRMVNASPRLKAIVARSDLIALGLVLTRYTLRNADEQRKWKREHDDQPLQPTPGVPGASGGPAASAGGADVGRDAAGGGGDGELYWAGAR